MRCLVTGATGFVGSHVVRLLLEQGCQVAVLVRRTSDLWRIRDILHRLHLVLGDLADLDQCTPLLCRFAPEVVFHLAWAGVDGLSRNDLAHLLPNLYGSLNLLHALPTCGCRAWIGLGSQAEYGHYEKILSEDSPTCPRTLYGVTKLCVSLFTQKLSVAYGMRFAWLRLFAVYGPMDTSQGLIPYVIRTLLQDSVPVLTSGDQRWDYLYVEDAARAIWQVADNATARGVFNLGAGDSITVRMIAEQIRDLVNPRLPLDFGRVRYEPDQVMLLQSNITRLKQLAGWSPQMPLAEGLAKTVDWHRDQMLRAR